MTRCNIITAATLSALQRHYFATATSKQPLPYLFMVTMSEILGITSTGHIVNNYLI